MLLVGIGSEWEFFILEIFWKNKIFFWIIMFKMNLFVLKDGNLGNGLFVICFYLFIKYEGRSILFCKVGSNDYYGY